MSQLSDQVQEVVSMAHQWLTEPLFTVGEASFSAVGLLKLLLFLALLVLVARAVRRPRVPWVWC